MRGLYEHSSADFLRRADSLCNTVEYQWVIADAPPTIDNGAKPRNPQAFSWVHEAFETMSMTRRQAAIPPLQFLFHFLWVFGDFFDADDPTDREGKYYIEFGVKPFKDLIAVPCHHSRRLKLANTKQDDVIFSFDPFLGRGRAKVINYLRNWVLHEWHDDPDDVSPVRLWPYLPPIITRVRSRKARVPPPRKPALKEPPKLVVPTRPPTNVLTVAQRALRKSSGNKRRHNPYARPSSAAKSSHREMANLEGSASEVDVPQPREGKTGARLEGIPGEDHSTPSFGLVVGQCR